MPVWGRKYHRKTPVLGRLPRWKTRIFLENSGVGGRKWGKTPGWGRMYSSKAEVRRWVHLRKFPGIIKTPGNVDVNTPPSCRKYFPVQNRCRPASSCVCTGISRSVLLQCTPPHTTAQELAS